MLRGGIMIRPSWKGVAGAAVLSIAAVTGIRAAGSEVSIVDAAMRGDRQAVRTLAQAGKVGQTAPDGTTALHWAVENNDVEMVGQLLKAGASATAATRYGVQPISLAAVNGNAAIMETLVVAGADVNTALPGGETVLMTAARGGQLSAVQFLIAKGADVNAKDATLGQTALMWAAARDNGAAVKALVAAGAEINVRTNNATRATGRTSESGNTFQAPAPTGFTPLLFATRAGAINATRVLIEAGANVNDALSDGESALVVATANANWQLADLLLDHGANPNLAGAGWNALHQTARERRPNIGFGTPGPIPSGTLDSINVAKKMIAKGVEINARMSRNGMKDGQRNRLNRLGATAFFLAAKNTDTELMKVLLDAGADASIPSADGTTSLMVAAGLAIWNPGEDGGSLMGQEDEVLEAVKMCIDRGVDVNAANQYGETALHGIAFRGVPAVAQYLADRGARLDAKDIHGWTPLAIANGLSYSDFFKEQVNVANLLRQLMTAKGLSIEGHAVPASVCFDCLQTRSDLAREVVERDKKMEAEWAASHGSSTQASK
jgi:ankyrin repeat protein